MSTQAFEKPISSRMHDLDVPLTLMERFKIGTQLGSAMLAGGLLIVGLVEWKLFDMEVVGNLIIAIASIIVSLPIFVTAIYGIFTRDADAHAMMEQLVALATLAAMMNQQFIVATLIPIIMNLGHFLEERSILGAQAAIDGLKTLQARNATLLSEDGTQTEVDPNTLKVNDLILVRPGDIIAADGEITEGTSTIDQSSITGESLPEDVTVGKNVFAGTINMTGVLKIRVTKTGEKTALGRVMELLQEAENAKTPVMKLIEKYATYYIPIILTIAGVVLFLTRDIDRAMAVLVVGCPGALVLAGPTAMIAALAAASKLGILIKNTRFLEALSNIDTVVLDKTGTVTIGHLQLSGMVLKDSANEKDLMVEALRCATGSRHPASKAIVKAAQDRDITMLTPPSAAIQEVPGKGVVLKETSETTWLGRFGWLEEEGFDMTGCEALIPENFIGTTVWLGRRITDDSGSTRDEIGGCFLMADRPRPEACEALQEMRDLGIERCVLLTGDRRATAEEIGKFLNMDQVIAEVLPSQKLDVVAQEKASGRSVMMVGDGVNDAPALASGDVGIALGAVASDIALQSADIALMTNDLRRLPMTIRLSRATQMTIHVNIIVGLGMTFFFIWLASLGVINSLTSALLHNVGEAFVIINSARLLKFHD
ncbi:MAG: cation-translocating P-type ATPase [Thermoguttaceae bacterium]|nr:cation-translocating P-type ATPase [Thermoguttaceae bacterium]MBR0192744.1 cation-translocating P-type ATPase [Thermoguttaceae bacterium]